MLLLVVSKNNCFNIKIGLEGSPISIGLPDNTRHDYKNTNIKF